MYKKWVGVEVRGVRGDVVPGSGYWLWLLIRNNRRDKVAYRQADLRGTPSNKPQEQLGAHEMKQGRQIPPAPLEVLVLLL